MVVELVFMVVVLLMVVAVLCEILLLDVEFECIVYVARDYFDGVVFVGIVANFEEFFEVLVAEVN